MLRLPNSRRKKKRRKSTKISPSDDISLKMKILFTCLVLCVLISVAAASKSLKDRKLGSNSFKKFNPKKFQKRSAVSHKKNANWGAKSKPMTLKPVTLSSRCQCKFDPSRRDCACCPTGISHCQDIYKKDRCQPANKHQPTCESYPKLPEFKLWTKSKKGCQCLYDQQNNLSCACCHHFSIQCPTKSGSDRCVKPENLELCPDYVSNSFTQRNMRSQENSNFEDAGLSIAEDLPSLFVKSEPAIDLPDPSADQPEIPKEPVILSESENTPKLQELLDFSEQVVRNGVKQPFISFSAEYPYEINSIVENIESELKNANIQYNTPEIAIAGRSASAGWCQYDSPVSVTGEAYQQPVTIPFYSFPETFEDQYGDHHCIDSQWKGISRLGNAISVIVSADNGPGLKNSYHQKVFKPCIEMLARSGVSVLGYINADISENKRTVFEIIQDSLAWIEAYGLRNIGGVYLNQLPGWYNHQGQSLYDVKFIANEIRQIGRSDWRVLVNPAVGVISL